jgi:cytochrome oxidase Cu insertion factor (SCO1/SenC/PrrC family)
MRIWLAILLVAVGAYGGYTIWRLTAPRLEATPSAPLVLDAGPKPMPELANIKLVERRGGNFSFDRLDGEVWIANMFFSSCPHTCARLTAVVRRLHEELPQAKFVSISVDPDNDTPDRLTRYAAENHAESDRWFFVTGDMIDVNRISQSFFGESIGRKQHRDLVVVVDRQGRRTGVYDAFDENDLVRLKKRVEQLVGERPTEATRETASDGAARTALAE